MYCLVTLTDVVQIHPSEFDKPSTRAIGDWINAKYADKVLHKVGLCVCFHSIISSSEGLIGHGTGIVNVNVDFRLLVFRPFKGEIVQGTIAHSDPVGGIYISMDFFDDVVVPPPLLFEDTEWGADDQGTQAFIWRPRDEETGTQDNEYFFDRAEKCYLRVEDEQWQDLSPQMQRPASELEDAEGSEGAMRKVPYLVRGSMMMSGLGPFLWWTGEEAAAEEGQDAMEEDEAEGEGVNGKNGHANGITKHE